MRDVWCGVAYLVGARFRYFELNDPINVGDYHDARVRGREQEHEEVNVYYGCLAYCLEL